MYQWPRRWHKSHYTSVLINLLRQMCSFTTRPHIHAEFLYVPFRRLNRGVGLICFKADLIKCCFTLTGLSELIASCTLPATSLWMTLGVMHTGSLEMKCFLLYTCAARHKPHQTYRTCPYVIPRGLWDMLGKEIHSMNAKKLWYIAYIYTWQHISPVPATVVLRKG